ncbi:type II toxin-antitoxin system RelE/ParE family toxin [Agrobacterium tumefaciens]|uniref:type II toxin-antitoxin system RelE/ParE family toxin n=1 Tax=Agrobacterium tumefaciens TaxID=358 RepID=UPI001044C233|nr:type II toxin-antitoxin system RelE/ParE family toxin [Agrobacterium tumefaciens]TCV55432.1 plasmid stabilization system protein ParE [Agrobacterium tumefaciens]
MAYKVLRSTQTDQDLGLILDHLIQSYLDLGDALPAAFTRAVRCVGSIEADMEALHKTPFQGTLLPEILPGLRRVTKNQAVFYFDIDEGEKTVRILAVFFGGQDHLRYMLTRLVSGRTVSLP